MVSLVLNPEERQMSPVSRPRLVPLGLALVALVLAGTALPHGQAPAGDHTLILLTQSNHTMYEVDPATGKVLHEFVAPDQAHEAAISADGSTIFASVPQAALVEIVDAKTFKQVGRIETEYFKRSPQIRPGRNGAPPGPPNTSASPHGMGLNNDGTKLYIGTENADVSGVVVYDVKARRVLKK